MTKIHEHSQLRIRAGLQSALCWGLGSAVVAFHIVAAMEANDRWQEVTWLGEYRSWLHSSFEESTWILIGCMSVFGSAAWIADVRQPNKNFVQCLLQVAAFSIIVWIVIRAFGIPPRRLKGIDHPTIYFSEFLYLVVPPLVVAAWSTWNSRTQQQSKE